MSHLFTHASLTGALVAATVFAGSAAHADAPRIRVVLESFMAYELEDSGHDEIYVEATSTGSSSVDRLFPSNGKTMSVARNDCVYLHGDPCPAGSNVRRSSAISTPSYAASNSTLIGVTLKDEDWPDADDVLIRKIFFATPISEVRHYKEEAEVNGFHYTFNLRIEPAYS